MHALSPAELPDRPGRRGVGSRDPPAPRKLLPSSPHWLAGAGTPEPSQHPAAGGFPEWGAMPRSALPPPLSGDSDLETESQMDTFARALNRKGSSADPHPAPTKHVPPAPRVQPTPPGASSRAFAAPGRVLPLFLALMVGPGQLPTPCACPPARVPTGPGPLGAGRAGLRDRSQRLRLGLQLLLAPPPAQFLPPDSARRDGAGPARPGGARGPWDWPASGRGAWGFPWGRKLKWVLSGGVRSLGKGN